MRLFGIGKDTTFNDLLEAQADAAVNAAREFATLAADFGSSAEYTRRIKEIEHAADELTHKLANKLDATFVTPLDKEDLSTLSSALDDITDAIEAAAGRVTLYQLAEARPDLLPLTECLVEAAEATRAAISELRSLRGREAIRETLVKVHDAENKADRIYREALATLMNAPGADPIQVIKWKEVYDRIEIATDSCEDVSNVVESVAIKYA